MNRTSPHAAFTLLEISMVLLIIALLAAGVTVGRTMIEATALQSVVADFDMYRQAVLSYRTKYGELPGDHTAATTITTADAGCSTPTPSNAQTTATCNGNGDGVIGQTTGNPLGVFNSYGESLLVWQHLANVGLIKGQYNGRRSTASNEITQGVNVPVSKLGTGTFILRYFPNTNGGSNYFQANYGHVFFYGVPGISASFPFNGPALTTEQAKAIDLKIDDGKPGLGKVLTSPASVQACPTATVGGVATTETTATYDSSITGTACALIFITGF